MSEQFNLKLDGDARKNELLSDLELYMNDKCSTMFLLEKYDKKLASETNKELQDIYDSENDFQRGCEDLQVKEKTRQKMAFIRKLMDSLISLIGFYVMAQTTTPRAIIITDE